MDRGLDQLNDWLGDIQLFKSSRSRRRFIIHMLVLTLFLVALFALVRPYLEVFSDPRELRSLILDFGVLGPIAIIGLQGAQVVLAPVPGQVLALVAGYLYGAWWGTLYNMIGVTIGSAIAFWLARRFGRPYVESIVHEDLLSSFDAIDNEYARLGLFIIFLVPGLPDDAICFLGGLTKLPLWQLVSIAVVGRFPAFFLINVVGESIEAGQIGIALIIGSIVLGTSAVVYIYREEILASLQSG